MEEKDVENHFLKNKFKDKVRNTRAVGTLLSISLLMDICIVCIQITLSGNLRKFEDKQAKVV